MPKLTRKSVRAEINKYGLDETKSNELLESIMSMFGASTADMISKEELEELKQKAIDEAMKGQPNNFKESQEYKDMSQRIQEYEKKDTIRTLTDKGVKSEKYAEMLMSKLDAEKDIDEQVNSWKEEYADMFNVEHDDSDQGQGKPQFGASTKGQMPKGKEGKGFMDVWGFVPPNK